MTTTETKTEPKKFELGDMVTFTAVLRRDGDRDGRRFWTPIEPPINYTTGHSGSGMIVGRRTLSNGVATEETEWDDWGNRSTWTEYRPTESIAAYIVAPSLHGKHIYVLPQHLELRP